MATLYFKVSSDWDQVVKLRQECEKLEAQLKKMDVNKSPASAKALETQLASTRQQMVGLVTEAANPTSTFPPQNFPVIQHLQFLHIYCGYYKFSNSTELG